MSPRHLIPNPEPITPFWSASIKLGKTTELEYYKYIYPRILFKRIIKDLKMLKLFDLRTEKSDLPEFWIKVYDIAQLREKYEAMLE